jgi:hypothetical protein
MRVSVFRIARGRHRLWDQAIQYPPVIQLTTAEEYCFGSFLEEKVLAAEGDVLRYGFLYGSGRYFKNERSLLRRQVTRPRPR